MPQFIHCRGGMMGWIASLYSSLSSPWLPWTSNIFVSRSHQQLSQPLFGGLTVQVHLQLWLFSLWLFVSSSARQSTSCAASPCTPVIHSHPFTFQTHPKHHKSSLHQRSGHQPVCVTQCWEEINKWRLKTVGISFFVMEIEHKTQSLFVNFLSLYVNPCPGKIHLSFSAA